MIDPSVAHLALLHRVVTPGMAYRLARWRPPAALGDGQLVFHALRRASAHVECDESGENETIRARRRAWLLRVPVACGCARATLTETAAVVNGDAARRYVVTWTDQPRFGLAAMVGGLLTGTVVAMGLPAPAWCLGPAAAAIAYAVDRRRVAGGNASATARSRDAFRRLIGAALVRPDAALDPTKAPAADQAELTIEQDGEIWRIGYRGTTLQVRHSRGLALLAHLVRSPGQEIHVGALDAMTPSGGPAAGRDASLQAGVPTVPLGDAGEILDAQARAEYRRRIVELRDALEDAEARADLRRAEALRAELEILEDEVRLAIGPGGRVRRAASDAERLRVAITHRIRSAIAQIAKRHPELGAHLSASVSTGYRCVYRPADRQANDERAHASEKRGA